jgi:hypothetical protein
MDEWFFGVVGKGFNRHLFIFGKNLTQVFVGLVGLKK